jgi:hypothetical protein
LAWVKYSITKLSKQAMLQNLVNLGKILRMRT